MQWDALESYFLSEFEDNDEKTKDNDKVTREVRLVRKFNDPFTKLYALFVQSIMPSFDAYYTFLQSEEPLVALLQNRTLNLYKALLSCCIKPDIIAQSDDILYVLILKIPQIIKNIYLYTLDFPQSNIHFLKISLRLRSIPNFLGKPNNFILNPPVIY